MLTLQLFAWVRLASELGQVRMLVNSRSRDVEDVQRQAEGEQGRLLAEMAAMEGEAKGLKLALDDTTGQVWKPSLIPAHELKVRNDPKSRRKCCLDPLACMSIPFHHGQLLIPLSLWEP